MANPRKVVIMGLGGGAGKVMSSIAQKHAGSWAKLLQFDTDVEALRDVDGVQAVTIGEECNDGQGCGGNLQLGATAAASSVRQFNAEIRGADLLLVVVCLGGGTGSGGVETLARLAREEGITTFFFVTLPMAAEGNRARQAADSAITHLHRSTAIVAAVPSDLLFSQVPPGTKASTAFSIANDVLADGIVGMAELSRCRGMLAVDFAHLKSLLANRNAICSFGVGRATGELRENQVVANLFESPMLGGKTFMAGADVVVVTLLAGDDLSIGELNGCLKTLHAALPQKVETVVGANESDGMSETLQLTMLVISYQRQEEAATTTAAITTRVVKKTEPVKKRTHVLPTEPYDDGTRTRQMRLPFAEEKHRLGIFGATQPTLYNEQNLDIPTFRRLGISLD
jgi:cell division protein FtsZ